MINFSNSWNNYIHKRNKMVANILGYSFKIIYKNGNKNIVVDDLSRKEEYTKGLLCANITGWKKQG